MTDRTTRHQRLLQELRGGLLECLEQHGGEAKGPGVARAVARVHHVHISYVTAAKWDLVDDGSITEDEGVRFKLTTTPRQLPDLLSLDKIRELRELLGDFAQRRARCSPYLELDDTQWAISTVLKELDRLADQQGDGHVA